jgi:hypothetical protein
MMENRSYGQEISRFCGNVRSIIVFVRTRQWNLILSCFSFLLFIFWDILILILFFHLRWDLLSGLFLSSFQTKYWMYFYLPQTCYKSRPSIILYFHDNSWYVSETGLSSSIYDDLYKLLHCTVILHIPWGLMVYYTIEKKTLRGFGPLANCADRATAACWRNRSSANFGG